MDVPYWLEEPAPPLRSRRLDGEPEVVVVGGGVTGCSCALTLARAGVRVRLHEGREIASGASGRNGGFALRGGAGAYDEARETLGPERARQLWELTDRGLERLAALAGDAFRRTGSLRVAASVAERDALEREYEALREDGFAAEWPDLPTALAGRFHGVLRHPDDGALQPARWVRRLASAAAEAGAELLERSHVLALDELGDAVVVLATDGYTRGLVPELDALVQPTRGQVLTTEPLGEMLFPCPHYARDGWDYWQQLPDRRLVIGGRRDGALAEEYTHVETTTPAVQGLIEELVVELVGDVPPVTHRWAGLFGSSPDRLPIVGPVPGYERVHACLGYSGHGNVLGLACGELVARGILGERPDGLELFDPARLLAAPSCTEDS
jgi:glycine/D-amino acid oxidase-like deaminating enzyme